VATVFAGDENEIISLRLFLPILAANRFANVYVALQKVQKSIVLMLKYPSMKCNQRVEIDE